MKYVKLEDVLNYIDGYYEAVASLPQYVKDDMINGLNNLPTKEDDWVSVDEGLPDDHVLILCFDGKQIQTAKYWADTNQYFSLALDGFMKVTHWQPLPSPPTK